jgi:dienelactone hydrolase
MEHPFLNIVMVDVEGPGGPMPVHLSRPEGQTSPTPGIIVCHHACGIYQDPFQKTFCDR